MLRKLEKISDEGGKNFHPQNIHSINNYNFIKNRLKQANKAFFILLTQIIWTFYNT